MMLFHAKASAGRWVGGRAAWNRAQLLAVEWGGRKCPIVLYEKN